jgi:hypothetical protein
MVTTRSDSGMERERMLRRVVFPEPVPPVISMFRRARMAPPRNCTIGSVIEPSSRRFSIERALRRKRRMERIGPSIAAGGMIAFTREPSGKRASTRGVDSSMRRPTREMIRSMIRRRCASSRNWTSVISSLPRRST